MLNEIFFILVDKNSDIPKDFHTGIPVWVPKSWRPRKVRIHFFTLIFSFRGYVPSTIRKAYFQERKHLSYFKPFENMENVHL